MGEADAKGCGDQRHRNDHEERREIDRADGPGRRMVDLQGKEVLPILERQFSKSAPGMTEKRASGLWALAVIHEKSANEELVKKFEGRVQDRNSLPPEFLPVRRSSVMALGLLRSTKSIPVVMESYQVDPPPDGIPDTARWILPLLGQSMPPEIPPARIGAGGWRIVPVDAP